MSVIDIGVTPTYRASGFYSGLTTIDLDNPANLSGILTSVDVFFNADAIGLRVGTFYLVSGTTYKCRDSAVLGSVTGAGLRVFSGLAIQVVAGDFIGFYVPTTGALAYATTGGTAGIVYAAGEVIDPGDSADFGSPNSGWVLSLAATGVSTFPKVNIGGTWKECSVMWVNIGGVWKSVVSVKVNIGGVWKDST